MNAYSGYGSAIHIHLLRGIDTLSKEVTRSKLFWFLSEKGDALWSKFIFFIYFFILEQISFHKRTKMQESNRKSQKLSLL